MPVINSQRISLMNSGKILVMKFQKDSICQCRHSRCLIHFCLIYDWSYVGDRQVYYMNQWVVTFYEKNISNCDN